MSITVHSFGISGLDAYLVDVEVKTIHGQPMLSIVGLADASIKEARERVESAITDLKYKFPDKKTVVNLAPSHIKKTGSHYDLPIAIAILIETNQVSVDHLTSFAFVGEVSLSGGLRPVKGILPMVMTAQEAGIKSVIVPFDNLAEANLIPGITCLGFKNLTEVIDYIQGHKSYCNLFEPEATIESPIFTLDFSEVKGQNALVHYLVVAAAGGHNLMMIGPPGCGKSMIAKRIPTILPIMTKAEALEVTKIYSISSDQPTKGLITTRPFRAPHHNASPNSIVGGGIYASPGEISLAHQGVLFLDEMPEFSKKVLESLRQPLEDGSVTISRVNSSNTYPAQFMLIGAMNPCPCGYYGEPRCQCSDMEITRYKRRLSGPILDRMDIQKYVYAVDFMDLSQYVDSPSSDTLRDRVIKARAIQTERFKNTQGVSCNAQMTNALIQKYCLVDEEGKGLLEQAFKRFQYSARTYHKYLRIARTFADLDGVEHIRKVDIAAALSARDLEKSERRS